MGGWSGRQALCPLPRTPHICHLAVLFCRSTPLSPTRHLRLSLFLCLSLLSCLQILAFPSSSALASCLHLPHFLSLSHQPPGVLGWVGPCSSHWCLGWGITPVGAGEGLTPRTLSPRSDSSAAGTPLPTPGVGVQPGRGPSAAVSVFAALLSPVPGCVRPRQVVGRQPRDRDRRLTHTGWGEGEPPPHSESWGRVGGGEWGEPETRSSSREGGVTLRAQLGSAQRGWVRGMGATVPPELFGKGRGRTGLVQPLQVWAPSPTPLPSPSPLLTPSAWSGISKSLASSALPDSCWVWLSW